MVLSASRRRRNRRPAGTAHTANYSFPISESSCRLVAVLRVDHSCSAASNSWSFSAGSRISCRSESSSRPRKVRMVAGPSAFSEATSMGPDECGDREEAV